MQNEKSSKIDLVAEVVVADTVLPFLHNKRLL